VGFGRLGSGESGLLVHRFRPATFARSFDQPARISQKPHELDRHPAGKRGQPGEEVATSGVFKLRNGAAVHINNTVRPGNNPSPKPENS